MQELRFVAVSEDGSYAVLAVPGRSGRYILPIDERLRAVALGQTSRLAQYEIEVESPLRPKEIQARIRAGETAEEIADAAGIPVERVRWFEGPVLAERAYIADQAQAGSVRRAGDSSGPGPRLGDIVTARLDAAGTDPADGQWDSRKRGDGNWQVSLTFPSGGRLHVAEWVFDPRRRHVMPDDDNAARLSLPESELPAEPVPMPGEATVTPIASRLGAAAGMGGGSVGGSGVSRFRPDRSVIPDRSLGVDRSLADRPMPPSAPAPERTAMPDRSAMSDRSAAPDRFAAPERPTAPSSPAPSSPAPSAPVPPRPASQDRPSYHDYVEFPESAPYRIPTPAEESQAHRDPAPEADHYRAPDSRPPAYRDPAPEPAAHPPAADVPAAAQVPAAQAAPAPDAEQPERMRPTPPRPVIFEDPGPAFPDEQAEVPQDLAPVQSAPTTAPWAAEPARATEPAATYPAAPYQAARPEPQAPPVAEPSAPPAPAREADAPAAEQAPAASATPAASTAAPVTSSQEAPAPAAAGVTGEPTVAARPEIRQSGPVAPQAGPAESVAAAASAPQPATPAEPAATAGVTPAGPQRSEAAGQVASSAEAVTPTQPEAPAESSAPDPAAQAATAPTATAPAATAERAGTADPREDAAAAAEDPGRPRSGSKKNAKGRRSSVPSWDEIMLGSTRQRD
jgi:hypothetical protein